MYSQKIFSDHKIEILLFEGITALRQKKLGCEDYKENEIIKIVLKYLTVNILCYL